LSSPEGLAILAALRRKQQELRVNYRTCTPEKLASLQAVDEFIEQLFHPNFKEYIIDTFEELKRKKDGR
jgi:hypothetical protein